MLKAMLGQAIGGYINIIWLKVGHLFNKIIIFMILNKIRNPQMRRGGGGRIRNQQEPPKNLVLFQVGFCADQNAFRRRKMEVGQRFI